MLQIFKSVLQIKNLKIPKINTCDNLYFMLLIIHLVCKVFYKTREVIDTYLFSIKICPSKLFVDS